MGAHREYQQRAVEAVEREWMDGIQSTLLVLPTGAGKTVVAAQLIKRRLPQRSMFIAHREELIFQAREKIHIIAGVDSDIEKAELTAMTSLWGRSPCVVASVQTLISGKDVKRMQRFKPEDFATLVIDECFPAGTTVDGRPIEEIRVGDYVDSVAQTSIESRLVTHVFKRKCRNLMTIHFKDGSTLRCTHEHPIWSETRREFIPAIMLDRSEVVLRLTTEYDYEFASSPLETLQSMRSAIPVRESQKEALFRRVQTEAKRGSNGGDKPKACLGKNEEKQPYEAEGIQGEDVSNPESNGPQTGHSRRQRNWANRAGVDVGQQVGVVDRVRDLHRPKGQRNSDSLQNRRGKPDHENSIGSGRGKPRSSNKAITRPQEGAIPCFVGVDYIEIHEQTSDGTFGGLCPDGHVYNLEVKQTNTYFANGVLVHNCHHATANSYREIIKHFSQNPNLKILGLSGTPDRLDEQALGEIFQSVAFDYEILDAIHDGWLVPVEQLMVSTDVDFSGIRTQAGDLNGADLAAVMEAEEAIQGVAGATINIVGNKRTLVFAASVKQAEMLCNIFNRHRAGSSEWVCGGTPKDQRRGILERFESGETQIVCNCAVLTEGFDCPPVETIVMARPTKSRALYAQCCGRSMRPLDGLVDNLNSSDERKAAIAASPKPSCLIIDFVGNSGKHKLMSTADILGGKVSDEAVEKAVERAKKAGGPVNMQQLLDEEEKKLQIMMEHRRLAEEARKAKVIAKVSYRTTAINPFDVFDLTPNKTRGWDNNRMLSEKQNSLLRRQGINPDDLNYSQGRQVLNELFRRWGSNLCTLKQAKVVKKYWPEVNIKTLTMKEATNLINQLAANGWKRPATN